MNICPKCNEQKPRYIANRRICRECALSRMSVYYKAHSVKRVASKAIYYANNKAKVKRYLADNAEEISRKQKQYREENREYVLALQQTWRNNNRKYMRQYAIDNRERDQEQRRQYIRENPESEINRKARRREREANGSGIPIGWKQCQYGNQDGRCMGCSQYISFDSMTIDHIIPLAKGGLHESVNCQLMCRKCNSSKGTKSMEEWVIVKNKGDYFEFMV